MDAGMKPEQLQRINIRWLKIGDAVQYSAIGKKRLVRLCKDGSIRGYQDNENKGAWIIDRYSIDEYHESRMPNTEIKNNVVAFLRRNL